MGILGLVLRGDGVRRDVHLRLIGRVDGPSLPPGRPQLHPARRARSVELLVDGGLTAGARDLHHGIEATTKKMRAAQATAPPTVAVPSPQPPRAPSFSNCTVSVSSSPGTTWRRNRTFSMPPNNGSLPANRSSASTPTAPAWASASTWI